MTSPPAPAVATPTPAIVMTPIYTDPTSQGVHTGSAVLIVMFANLALGALLMPMWVFCFRKMAPFRTQGASPDVWATSLRQEQGCGKWVRELFSAAPFEGVARSYGTDTALYLAFMKCLTLIAGLLCATSTLVYLPMHMASLGDAFTDENMSLQHVEDELFTRTTVQGISQTPGIMYLHVLGIVGHVIAIFAILRRFVKIGRRIFAANHPEETCISERTVKVTGLPGRGVSEADLRDHFEKQYPGAVESVHLGHDVRERITCQTRLEKILLRMKYESLHGKEKTLKQLQAKRADAIEDIKEWERHPPTACVGFAHVVFRVPETKIAAMRKRIVAIKPSGCKVEFRQAHHPRDINWLEVGRSRTACSVLVNIVLALCLVFFSTPTAIFTTFQQATEKIDWVHNFFTNLESLSDSKFGALMFQYLPVIFYLVLSLVLPLVIEWVTKKQPQVSLFDARQLVLKRLYVYLLLCVFILPSIALSTVSALISVFQNGGEHGTGSTEGSHAGVDTSMHHLFLSDSGAFFFNILQVYATVGNYYELFRPLELFQYAKGKVWRKYEAKDSWMWVEEFEFSWQYPLTISSFAICLNYAVFVPLTSLAWFVMIWAKMLIHTRHARSNVFCRRNALDGQQFGRLVKTLIVMMELSMVICCFFAACFFIFRTDSKRFIPHTISLLLLMAGVVQRTFVTWKRPKSYYVHETTLSRSLIDQDDSPTDSPVSPRSEMSLQVARPNAESMGSADEGQSPFTLPMLTGSMLESDSGDCCHNAVVPNVSILKYHGEGPTEGIEADAATYSSSETDEEAHLPVSITHHLYAAPFMANTQRKIVRLAQRRTSAAPVEGEDEDEGSGSDKAQPPVVVSAASVVELEPLDRVNSSEA